MSATLILYAIGLVGTLGGGTWLAKRLLQALPHLDVHTRYAVLNSLLNTFGNGAIDVLKSILTSGDIDALLTAVAAGTPIRAALAGLLPTITKQVEEGAGPLAKDALAKLLGGDEAAATRIEQLILSAAHDIWTTHKTATAGATPQPGQVVTLPSGHILVVPHGQALPEGASLLASLPRVV